MLAAAAQFAYSWEEAKSHGHPDLNGAWNGDVFKALLQLRAERRDLNVSVLDCDHGLGIVRRGAPEGTLDLSADQIASMTYEEFAPRRIELLNLKPATIAS